MDTRVYEYGNPDSSTVLLQMVDDHDLAVIENEVAAIRNMADDFRLLAVKVKNWNLDLSRRVRKRGLRRWRGENTGCCAGFMLGRQQTVLCGRLFFGRSVCFVGGVSDGRVCRGGGGVAFGLVSRFCGLHGRACDKMRVYLSLGDREEKVRNPVMAAVGENIRRAYDCLAGQGVDCVLEWNRGNHFTEPDIRTAKAFAWLIGN